MYRVEQIWGGVSEVSVRPERQRVEAVDLLRGLVIVLMVLDHVRDYFHAQAFLFSAVNPDQSYPALFATRWVTHLCAPVFVMLAGVSAGLQLRAGKSVTQVRKLLWTRGLWLIALELTVVTFGFNFGIPIPFLQVFWAIGWSMLALAAVLSLTPTAIGAIGAAILLGHNLLDPISPSDLGAIGLLWQFLHEGGPIVVGGTPVGMFAYPVLPWVGVMFLGDGAARLFGAEAQRRRRLLAGIGAAMLAAFFMLRALNVYGDPDPWAARGDSARTVMAFLDVEKYPPSLLYVLATLGVAMLLVPLLERLPRIGREALLTFGRVPLFAYLAHIYIAHFLMMVVATVVRGDPALAFNFVLTSVTDPEALGGWGFGLPVVYAACIATLILLYPLCRWFGAVKRRRRDWWLSYL